MGFLKRILKSEPDVRSRAVELTRGEEKPPDFPFELTAVRGVYALENLQRFREQWRDEGFTPVIIGDAQDVADLNQGWSKSEGEPQELLKLAGAVDVELWLEQRRAENPEAYRVEEGQWDGQPAEHDPPHAHRDRRTGKPKPTVYIARIPADRDWQIPAYVRLGGRGNCPATPYHIAIARHWFERYEARIITVRFDTLEFEVDLPPQDPESARKLARQQFIYCPDITQQGFDTIGKLAASVLKGRSWYFWWD